MRASEITVVGSLLDRLLDYQPDVPHDPGGQRQSVSDLKKSLVRDLEALFNTRQEALHELSPEYAMVGKSLFVYGLPDFTSYNPRTHNDRNRILGSLEKAIANFEPRLAQVRIRMEQRREHSQALHFRVEAVLSVDSIEEPVTFDTILQLTTHVYEVQGRDS